MMPLLEIREYVFVQGSEKRTCAQETSALLRSKLNGSSVRNNQAMIKTE